MSKLPRVTQPIFAAAASNNGQFGSAQAGTKVVTNSLATIMSLSAWGQGWLDAVVGASKFPALEEFQAIDYVITSQLAYLFQEGVPEYDSGTTYFQHSIVKQVGSFRLYGSLTDNNIGNALTDPTNWKFLQDLAGTTGTVFTGSAPSGGTANAQTLTTTLGTFTLTAGNIVDFVAGHTNTGATTLAVDGTAATTIKKQGTSGLIDLVAGDITTSQAYVVIYDGVFFELQTSLNPAAFLQVANNLSDVNNAASALSNLGGAAKSNNLSDLANIATALGNLGFLASLGSSGYLKIPTSSGLAIFQWGTAVIGNTTNFPITYNTACYSLLASSTSPGGGNNNYEIVPNIISASQFYIFQTNKPAGTASAFWMSIGK